MCLKPRRRPRPPSFADELEALLGYRWPMGRPPKHNVASWTVTDDWPEQVPISEAEIVVFEQWFGDVIDDLIGVRL